MPFDSPLAPPDWTPAIRRLRRVDPVLRQIIDRVGPCTLAPRPDPYAALCQAIFSQQVSTAVAKVLFSRFLDLFPGRWPTPARVLKMLESDPERVRACGLSRQKYLYVRDLTEHFVAGAIPVRDYPSMTDQQIIDSLVRVKGVGVWTAEMFLINVLNRPDLLPVDDLGIRKGVQIFYSLPELPSKQAVLHRGEAWRPWRTVASWYLWRGQAPQHNPSPKPHLTPARRTA